MKHKIYEFVGKTATVQTGGMTVDVKIVDVKNSYGRDRFLVTPIKGSGEVWVENVTFEESVI